MIVPKKKILQQVEESILFQQYDSGSWVFQPNEPMHIESFNSISAQKYYSFCNTSLPVKDRNDPVAYT